MGYFRELPDLLYQSNLQHKISSREYVRVKNFFRRVKLVDELRNAAVLFDLIKFSKVKDQTLLQKRFMVERV